MTNENPRIMFPDADPAPARREREGIVDFGLPSAARGDAGPIAPAPAAVPAPGGLFRARVPEGPVQEGTVPEGTVREGTVPVQFGGERREASVAPSCLLAPFPGDEVLVFSDGDILAVVAVLKRDEGSEARLDLPARTRIGAKELEIRSERVGMFSKATEVRTGAMKIIGGFFDLKLSGVAVAAKNMFLNLGHYLSRSGVHRVEAETGASVRAKRIKMEAVEDFKAEAGNIDLKAEKVAKMDGRNVRLG
ncbi:MAG: DUF3540 domain-containing protein [Deltaproteobacteria bacterium]|jgi:hypothetical protein|nr:DUF3540 domain-containing protein [Deltaproteobacteria bacterium]